ncbi:MAG: type I secretion system permease/ATPase [Pseudomonadota bacterium]
MLLIWAGVFSAFVNLLMLTGPLFMLQVYDRVLASRSDATLVALLILVTALYALMGVLDFARGRVMARVGARVHALLSPRVEAMALSGRSVQTREAPQELAALQQTLSGPGPFVFFDAPWAPIFIAALFVFHFWLGMVAVAGGVLMIILALLNQWRSRRSQETAQAATGGAERLADALSRERPAIRALGMSGAVIDRLAIAKNDAMAARIAASDRTGGYASTSKALRLWLQSAMLAAGAALAIQGAITAGAMIAASILLGRALAPVEQAVAQWPSLARGRRAWNNLETLLSANPAPEPMTPLPKPQARLVARNLSVSAPSTGMLCVVGVTVEVEPGEAVAIVGPSGSGKTSLAYALTGLWPATAGGVRIDGAAFDQWPADAIGRHLGYLPQDVGLMAGTIATNIARLDIDPDPEAIVAAARRAGAHEMILRLPEGYDTWLDPLAPGGVALSGGQRQRIGLARAFYGDPAILILDEPNAHLDLEGERALIAALQVHKKRGGAAVIMAHRPSAISVCDRVLRLERGRIIAAGTPDDVLGPRKGGAPRSLVASQLADAARAAAERGETVDPVDPVEPDEPAPRPRRRAPVAPRRTD